jgi:uncharacterized membrane protein
MQQRFLAMLRLAAVRFTRCMSSSPVVVLAAGAAFGSAVVGGVFFAFSTFVMRGLDRSGAQVAGTAMRGINAQAEVDAPFLMLLFGSALLAVAVGFVAVVRLRESGSGWVLAGAVLAVLPLIVTVAFSVPLNDQLAALDPATLSAAEWDQLWQDYFRSWMRWNHVRTIAPLLGSVLMAVGLRSGQLGGTNPSVPG